MSDSQTIKQRIYALVEKYPIAYSDGVLDSEPTAMNVVAKPEGRTSFIEAEPNHLDEDFVSFLSDGGHLDLDEYPLAM